jgi:hypothetical protein
MAWSRRRDKSERWLLRIWRREVERAVGFGRCSAAFLRPRARGVHKLSRVQNLFDSQEDRIKAPHAPQHRELVPQ